jgi:Tfp pilus assembly protein FimV
MRKIVFWLAVLIFTVSLAQAQDAATQQQLDKLFGQIQDMQATQEQQGKQLAALQKQINDLADKVNSPAVNNSANADDLKALAAQVQEIDKKRLADRELILDKIKELGAISGGPSTGHRSKPVADTPTATANGDNATPPAVPQKGYDYTIAPGDTVSAIAKAYRAQGVKVTTAQIIAANPKMNPNALIAGKKIFIPDPAAK